MTTLANCRGARTIVPVEDVSPEIGNTAGDWDTAIMPSHFHTQIAYPWGGKAVPRREVGGCEHGLGS